MLYTDLNRLNTKRGYMDKTFIKLITLDAFKVLKNKSYAIITSTSSLIHNFFLSVDKRYSKT